MVCEKTKRNGSIAAAPDKEVVRESLRHLENMYVETGSRKMPAMLTILKAILKGIRTDRHAVKRYGMMK